MTVRCEDYDHVSVLALSGEFTADTVDLLRRHVEERLERKVRFFVLDLEATTFMDSKALETILWVQEKCDEVLGQVRLCRPDETCGKILHVTRLDGRFDVFNDVAKAVKTMQ